MTPAPSEPPVRPQPPGAPVARHAGRVYTGPDILPPRLLWCIEDFEACVELKAARVAAGHSPADDLERALLALLAAVRGRFPDRVPGVDARVAEPLSLRRTSHRYEAFAEIDPAQPSALDRVDLVARHGRALRQEARAWSVVNPPVAPFEPALSPCHAAAARLLRFQVDGAVRLSGPDDTEPACLVGTFVGPAGTAACLCLPLGADAGPDPLLVHEFALAADPARPQVYTTLLALGTDHGAPVFAGIHGVHRQIEGPLTTLLNRAGALQGGVGPLDAPGALVGEVSGRVIAWLDDLVRHWAHGHTVRSRAHAAKAVLRGDTATWGTDGADATDVCELLAGERRYRVAYTWSLVA